MGVTESFEYINEAKVNLQHIYNQPDPRSYFRELRKLNYAIPGAALPIFQKLISYLKRRKKGAVRLLDIGCSYGVNAALLKYGMTMPDLYEHWGQERLARATPSEVVECDRLFFCNAEIKEDIEVIGLDVAENAIGYAENVGLLEKGIVANLEERPLSKQETRNLASVDLVLSTGCVGYVTEKSFDRLLPRVSKNGRPWIANFVLRMFPYDNIERALLSRGYVTEKLEGETFLQRIFAGKDEQQQVVAQLHEQGLDPTGKEAEGQFHAEFFLSRPPAEVESLPLPALLAV